MSRGFHWISWFAGAALVAAVIVAALHFSEAEEIARLAQRAQPAWLLLAILLQLGTYLAKAGIWRAVGVAANHPLPRWESYRLSVAELFVDQAVPMMGIGGTAAVANYLERRGMPRPAVMAGVVINLASYFAAYVVLLVLALLLLPLSGAPRAAALAAAVIFIGFSLALVVMSFVVPGRAGHITRWLMRLRPLRSLGASIAAADSTLVRSPALFARAFLCQVAIVLQDALTVYVLIHALGGNAPVPAVFGSFMIANLFRSLGFLPGGLGTFEAASVFTLQLTGIALPAALSVTLLFRGLSFWLPMIPGAWLSRHMFGAQHAGQRQPGIAHYWALPPDELLRRLESGQQGLSAAQAAERLRIFGANQLSKGRSLSRARILARQFASPLLLLLVFAALIAGASGDLVDAGIVLAILLASALIGYSREYRAHSAAEALRARILTRASVLRDGEVRGVPVEEVVPGDVIMLTAGSLVPADAVILAAIDCYLSEAVLTGESFPVAKQAGAVAADAVLRRRSNCVYLGTNVRSGTARCLVTATGAATQFGAIAQRLVLRAPQTEFDRGLSRFGYLLTTAMLSMVLVVFAAHMIAGRPAVETLLFAVALAVGLSPELLPAILSINLARGAQLLARDGVLVRHLNAIENLGSMDTLCTDKTGTLTEGVINLHGGFDPCGATSQELIELGAINASLETGLASPLDDAIVAACKPDLSPLQKLAEIPFDFVRKRVSVVVQRGSETLLISKGAFDGVLQACGSVADGTPLDAARRTALERLYAGWCGQGIRVLAVATRVLATKDSYGRDDEHDLVFRGFLTFLDRPKSGAAEALAALAALGIAVKLITGDSRLVAQHVAALVGMRHERVLTGAELDLLHDEALWREAERIDLFVEVDPNQKERIILALKKMGHVVGFLGDGVNDAPAMHAADTSLSVEHAVDVAREAADFVLLRRDLEVIRRGVQEGRRTFANTLKYVLTTTSANLGNMVSMAVVSLVLPFLPLTAGQILLNNFLSDVPAVGIADDAVDPELVQSPRRWDIRFIGRFMVEFGLLSSLFDFLTFAALLSVFHAPTAEFRSAWFVESLLTELVIALVVRTRRPFFRSRPGKLLLVSTLILAVATPLIPFLPFADTMGFVPLPPALLMTVVMITACYVLAAEVVKRGFYRDKRN